MSRRSNTLCGVALAASLLVAHAGDPRAAETGAARIEVHPIETLDVPTATILRGDALAPATPTRTIAGELRLPTTAAVRVPAIVFLHGDAGAVADQPPWIDEFVAMGIAVFTVDSFSGRDRVSASPQVGSLGGTLPGAATRIVDAYRALAILAAHPRIDASRIALMGVSSGGRTTLMSGMKRFAERFARTDARFAAYVALYPPCNARFVDEERVESGPIRIFIGGADNVTPAVACERFVTRLKQVGADAEVTIYPGAFHGFDNPPGTPTTHLPDVAGFTACSFVERDGGLVNVETGSAPREDDRCVTRGFTAGRDAAADAAARAAVRAFFARQFLAR